MTKIERVIYLLEEHLTPLGDHIDYTRYADKKNDTHKQYGDSIVLVPLTVFAGHPVCHKSSKIIQLS